MLLCTRFSSWFVLLIFIFSLQVIAQWSTNPAVNNAICTATDWQQFPTIVSDGTGGAIITWTDLRSGNYHIYAQRINAAGGVQWNSDGISICTATVDQDSPTIVSDDSGGAIITWRDYRSGTSFDIYAQRINASGAVQWSVDGVAICTATGDQDFPTIVSDNSRGAIITWQDYRSGAYADIYAQHINTSGTVQWGTNGVAICTASGEQQLPKIVSDGSGGAIITWYGNGVDDDIYAQHINATGAVQWTADGVVICAEIGTQFNPMIVSDNTGGAIITWNDGRNGNSDIYAQHINASGTVQWTVDDGVAICTETGSQSAPTIVSDGSGGAIITWEDLRNGVDYDIYVQRINASGAVLWSADGVEVCTAGGDQESPMIVSDNSGGAIITWYDGRNGISDIYAQHINAAGAVQWSADGVAISTATGQQHYPTIVSDGTGGAIITWEDFRSGIGYDIYASQIDANGSLGVGPLPVPVELTSFSAQLNGNGVELVWKTATEINNYGFVIEKSRIQNTEVRSQNTTEGWTKIGFIEGSGTTNAPKEYSFSDKNLTLGKYSYRLKQIDRDGKFKYSSMVDANVIIVNEYAVSQNYPNPFNPSTKIDFTVKQTEHATVKIFDITGHEVTTLFNAVAQTGQVYTVQFNASQFASGMYFYVVSTKNFRDVKKMSLLK